MASYSSEYPSMEVDGATKSFFEQFYQISDTPDAHEQYAQQFTRDATLIMASKKCQGFKEILALRHGMWEKVASRKHKPLKVYPFGPNSNEVMLYGTVDYDLKDGRHASVDWAARAHVVNEDGRAKMDFYQVYLVSGSWRPLYLRNQTLTVLHLAGHGSTKPIEVKYLFRIAIKQEQTVNNIVPLLEVFAGIVKTSFFAPSATIKFFKNILSLDD